MKNSLRNSDDDYRAFVLDENKMPDEIDEFSPEWLDIDTALKMMSLRKKLEKIEIERNKALSKNNKQGPCGFFCFKFWIGEGCDDDCIMSDYKIKGGYLIIGTDQIFPMAECNYGILKERKLI